METGWKEILRRLEGGWKQEGGGKEMGRRLEGGGKARWEGA